ncbi:hypothetical protein F383_26860 [Gossypium arboreum]|uniref:Uncharacterized protein n=1 Tax=Gossypium arboreum TaxID=29729 RepID=A0A0B0MP05_GOSAR|nr:hypothetical protein F383_26860 [Gossypium arboreum]
MNKIVKASLDSGIVKSIVTLTINLLQIDLERAVADDVESNAPDLAQRTASAESRLSSSSQRGEAKQDFFQMTNEWFVELV